MWDVNLPGLHIICSSQNGFWVAFPKVENKHPSRHFTWFITHFRRKESSLSTNCAAKDSVSQLSCCQYSLLSLWLSSFLSLWFSLSFPSCQHTQRQKTPTSALFFISHQLTFTNSRFCHQLHVSYYKSISTLLFPVQLMYYFNQL